LFRGTGYHGTLQQLVHAVFDAVLEEASTSGVARAISAADAQGRPMTGKKRAKETKPVAADDRGDLNGRLKNVGGSRSDHWNNILAEQVVQALWLKHSDPATRERQFSATVAALIGIRPQDELEGMIAAQLIAAHNAAMECYRRAMIAAIGSRPVSCPGMMAAQ
jgi:hypothetical protein